MSSSDDDDDLASTVALAGKHNSDATLKGFLQVVVIGEGMFATHHLPDGAAVTIGRSNRCDISVDDDSISRRHAILNLGTTATIEDLGSVNGVIVRGTRLPPKRPTSITIGEPMGLGKISIILQQRSRPERAQKLFTRESFATRLHEECARVLRTEGSFALLRIHCDSHAPESFVERTLGELLREADILGEHRPRELQALLTDTPAVKAEEAARRIRRKLRERGLKCRIDVACCPRDGQSPDELALRLHAAAEHKAAEIVVEDAQMQSLHRLIEQVAASNMSVLLLGETGVGKEVFARALHRASPRAAGPFVELNCAALTETLLESELFGHEKGAFTHAVAAKPGLIETAHGGTIMLDEIGDMPLSTQVKLLRVIEDSQLRRVGGLKAREIDVRFVAATNSDLEARVMDGTFRRDLFFRLNGVTIVIPPLRERLAELEPMARAFIKLAKPDAGPSLVLASETLATLMLYSWPGNVRELKHLIERAVAVCGEGPIRPEHLPRLISADPKRSHVDSRPPLQNDVQAISPRRKGADEQLWIMQALEQAGGNQTLAARLLGISRRTLVNRLNEYKQIHRPRKGVPPNK